MSVALHLYQQLRDAPNDDSRAKAIAEAFEQIEERYPNLKDVATQGHLRETELRLQKEIKEVEVKIKETELRLQKEIKEVELNLQKEIKGIEVKIKETELRLQKEIREVESRLQRDIKALEVKIAEVEVKVSEVEVRLTRVIHRQTFWLIGSIGTIIGFIRLLDWFLARLPHP